MRCARRAVSGHRASQHCAASSRAVPSVADHADIRRLQLRALRVRPALLHAPAVALDAEPLSERVRHRRARTSRLHRRRTGLRSRGAGDGRRVSARAVGGGAPMPPVCAPRDRSRGGAAHPAQCMAGIAPDSPGRGVVPLSGGVRLQRAPRRPHHGIRSRERSDGAAGGATRSCTHGTRSPASRGCGVRRRGEHLRTHKTDAFRCSGDAIRRRDVGLLRLDAQTRCSSCRGAQACRDARATRRSSR